MYVMISLYMWKCVVHLHCVQPIRTQPIFTNLWRFTLWYSFMPYLLYLSHVVKILCKFVNFIRSWNVHVSHVTHACKTQFVVYTSVCDIQYCAQHVTITYDILKWNRIKLNHYMLYDAVDLNVVCSMSRDVGWVYNPLQMCHNILSDMNLSVITTCYTVSQTQT